MHVVVASVTAAVFSILSSSPEHSLLTGPGGSELRCPVSVQTQRRYNTRQPQRCLMMNVVVGAASAAMVLLQPQYP